jgi:hypothetical protein
MTAIPFSQLVLVQVATALLAGACGWFLEAAINRWEVGLLPLVLGFGAGCIAWMREPEDGQQ